jgi:SAM-dependent methyltransferase
MNQVKAPSGQTVGHPEGGSNDAMWQERYLERFYPLSSWRRDGTKNFFSLCERFCQGKILEIGAGPSNRTSNYLATLGELHGLDVDSEILSNKALTTASVIKDRFPFPDSTFDACASDFVCEHLADPRRHLEEIWRVLKPGGVYLFRTPNRFHYVAMVSAVTPHSFHLKFANRLRLHEGHDPYPTYYRFNSRRKIGQIARQLGFEVEYLKTTEWEPSYGMSSRLFFLLFTMYERLVNSSSLFSDFRANLFVVLRKPKTDKFQSANSDPRR